MDLREKYVTVALIVFIVYFCALIALFIISGTDIITAIEGNVITINPRLTELAAAGLVLLALPLIVIEAHLQIKTPLGRKIVFYLVLYFLLQLGLNTLLLISLLITFPTKLDLTIIFGSLPSPLSSGELGLIWIICLAFSILNIIINCFLGWRWKKKELPLPSVFHWFLGYVVLLSTTGIRIVLILLTGPEIPSLFYILLGFVVLPALGHFYASFGILIFVAPIIFPFSGESAFFVALLILSVFYIFGGVFLLFLPFLLFYLGFRLAKSESPSFVQTN